MRLIILLAALFLPLPALAASYMVNTTAAQETAITAARNTYNAGLAGGAANPSFQATNGSYLLFVVTSNISDWARHTEVQPVLPSTDQTNAITLLNACVSANGLGGLTQAQCQSLLTEVQTATNVP